MNVKLTGKSGFVGSRRTLRGGERNGERWGEGREVQYLPAAPDIVKQTCILTSRVVSIYRRSLAMPFPTGRKISISARAAVTRVAGPGCSHCSKEREKERAVKTNQPIYNEKKGGGGGGAEGRRRMRYEIDRN